MAKTPKKNLPVKWAAAEKAIFTLVSEKGVSKNICINTFGLGSNHFNIFQGTDANYNKALAIFTSEVLMKAVVGALEFSAADRKFIMTKLRVFDKEIELPIKKMTTAAHASQNLSFAMDAYARKEISDDTFQQIRAACETFSKLMIATDIETRLGEIERLFSENAGNNR